MKKGNEIRFLYSELEAIKAKCLELIAEAGYTQYLIAVQSCRIPSCVKRFVVTSYPEAWLKRYDEREYVCFDPVLARAMNSTIPFYWDRLKKLSPLQKMVMREAEEFGITSGLTMSLQASPTEQIYLSLAGPNLDHSSSLNKPERIALAHKFLCDNCDEIVNGALGNIDKSAMRALTQPQCEVLTLVMCGMTTKQIARQLGIHIRAVEDRLSRASKRLKANSRGQAILRAISSGQIAPVSNELKNVPAIEAHLHDLQG